VTVPEPELEAARACWRSGDLDGAARRLAALLERDPDAPAALGLLGAVQARRGDLGAAARCLERAAVLDPEEAAHHLNLGNVYLASGRPGKAAASFQAAVARAPDSPEAHGGLATALKAAGRLGEAIEAYGRAIALRPAFADAHNNLGTALKEAGRIEDAEASYRRAVEHAPRHPVAWSNLANALTVQGRYDEAIAAYRHALELAPDNPDVRYNLANTLVEHGAFDEAEAHFRAVVAARPDHVPAWRNLLYVVCLNPERTPQQVLEAHRLWGDRLAAAVGTRARAAHPNPRDPERVLHVGYLSPDFRAHAVAAFLEPVLRHHDPAAVAVTCYASVPRPDAVTERLKGLGHRWRDVHALPDAAVAEQVSADGIDLLVDLAGHTHGSRLSVLALKPAPVQATYLGYPTTTGLEAVDYRLTDRWADPEGAETPAVERTERIEGGFCCFQPADAAPPVGPLPARKNGHVTFGSLANTVKIHPGVVALWARVLDAVPGARLRLCRSTFDSPHMAARFRDAFGDHGIAPERVECVGRRGMDKAGFLGHYGDLDIALDTFPYAGHTTTCEALWMGVPLVTLAGDAFISRVGASILNMAGLEHLVAGDPDAFVAAARALADDLDGLEALRASLRERLAASPLLDAPGFARRLEAAYRRMWRRRCEAR
jgi:protein O-GlcNAc transferase